MKIPLIGITCGEDGLNFYVRNFYIKAIEAVGGAALMIPPTARQSIREKYLKCIDGLILSGGVDVNPLLFGEEPILGMGEITPERDAFELSWSREFFFSGKPILAVCRGCQVLNLSLGGTIFQDIKSQLVPALKHDQEAPRECLTHSVNLVPGTRLSQIMSGDHIQVNSFHHQAVKTPAPGLQVSAVAADQVVEGIEGEEHSFALGVQWHPECLWRQDIGSYRLFQAFIQSCRR
ncbi:gamma-glutamyl-gamma-aminobutyrate hydrolase family protein [Dehalobacterium formicoaceticum]|uniref:gamma-glutamyl-gamma-aminobutyrate hydrolase family protein n=1 Tax=Dehalobacterium formicoaceticum TaxID=51515 RepID=UPI0031F70563